MPAVLSKNGDRGLKRLKILFTCIAGFAVSELSISAVAELQRRILTLYTAAVEKADIDARATSVKCDKVDDGEADEIKNALLKWGNDNHDKVTTIYFYFK